jgi:septum formation topological specificity factor MinE
MKTSKKSDFNQEEFRKEITEVINKYFTGDLEQIELSIDEVVEIFGLGFKTKYKNNTRIIKNIV